MKAERIIPLPLDKKQGAVYAVAAAEEKLKNKVAKVNCLGGGSFGLAFDLEFKNSSHTVVKLLRAKEMLLKEVYDLTLLRNHSPIRFPKVLFSREGDTSIPFDCYAMEKIEGKTAFTSYEMLFLSKQKRIAFAEKVTDALHAIHTCKNNRFGDTANPIYHDWLDCYKPFAEDILEKAEELFAAGQLSPKVMSAMRAAWNKFDVIFSEKVEEACLIHGDLNVGNIMVDNKHEITGFIDPLNSMYADKEYDLFQFNNMTGKRFYLCDIYKRNYGASKYCDQKLAFYGLWNEVFCYIKSGAYFRFIMNPLVKNMHKQLSTL